MPVAGASGTFELDAAMKVLFEDTLENDVVSDSELFDLIEKDTDIQTEVTGGGRYIERAHMLGLPAGYGYRTESDAIPSSRGPQLASSRIKLKKSMGSVSVTGDVFAKIKQGKEAFTTWAEDQIPALTERMRNTKDAIMVGYGAGVRARVGTIDAVNKKITLVNALGIAGYTNAFLQFLANEDVAFGPNVNGTSLRANAAAANNVLVTDVNPQTNTLTLSEIPTGLAANDYIFSADETGASTMTSTGENREFMGLHGHVDDGGILLDYFGINRSTTSAFRSTIANIAGAPYNGLFNDEAILYGDMQGRLYGNAEIDVLAVPYSGALTFWKDLKNDRMLTDPRTWTGGAGKLAVNIRNRVVEVRGIRKMPPQTAFGLTKGCFRRFTLGKFEWVTRTGSMWQQVISSGRRYDAFWAYGVDYDEIFCKAPNKQIRWDGLSG